MAVKQTHNPTGYATGPDFGPLFGSASVPTRPSVSPAPTTPPTRQDKSTASQLAAFAKPLPTSADTAARVSEGRRQRILQFIANNGPTTIHEFCAACSTGSYTLHAHQVSGRFTDMAKVEFMTVVGQRPHPVSGCACQVYDITDRGRQELARLKGR